MDPDSYFERPIPQNPSRRTPKYETHCNLADQIERQLAEDGHSKWGFVIYRCTYDKDDDWNEVIKRLQDSARKTLEFYNGLDLIPSMLLTIIEDKETLDDASTSTVRSHFLNWIQTAPQLEQGTTNPGQSARYQYCIQIDPENLECILDDTMEDFVNIISADWLPEREQVARLAAEYPNRKWNLNPFVEVMDKAIEGCTERDVGWVHVHGNTAMVEMYESLYGDNSWEIVYQRPPKIVGHF